MNLSLPLNDSTCRMPFAAESYEDGGIPATGMKVTWLNLVMALLQKGYHTKIWWTTTTSQLTDNESMGQQ